LAPNYEIKKKGLHGKPARIETSARPRKDITIAGWWYDWRINHTAHINNILKKRKIKKLQNYFA
jgi:hypothetical protein